MHIKQLYFKDDSQNAVICDVVYAEVLLLYPFIQFEQHVTFLIFQQISKITINWEKIIGGVNENWVWCVTFELNEMVQ